MKIEPQLKEDLKKYIQNRISQQKNIVYITAPYALHNEEINTLKSQMPFLHDAEIITEIDTTLLAGVVIKFGSKMIDLSLNSELQKLQQFIYEIA